MIIMSKGPSRNFLIVQPTAGGKTHIIRMLCTYFRGIHVITHPILALSGDQVEQFRKGNEAYGPIEVHNLDRSVKVDPHFLPRLICHLRNVPTKTSRTIILIASPQLYTKSNNLVKVLHHCHRKGTFRSLHHDEGHLLAQHGESFRWQIRDMAKVLIAPIDKGIQD